MAAQTPFFMSGPRLLLKIDGIKIAYAVGLDLRVSRNVQIVNTLGSFASVALQATMYNGVSGSMQIVRLLDTKSRTALETAAPGKTATTDNELIGLKTVSNNPNDATTNSLISATKNLAKHLDPSSVLASSTFDIEVWQMYPTEETKKSAGEQLNNEGVLVKHFTVQNCRLNSRSASISAGQLLTESFSFTGTLLVSEDRTGADNADLHDVAAFGTTNSV